MDTIPANTVSETLLFCIEAVHSLPLCWTHEEYLCHVQVYHGTRPLNTLHLTNVLNLEDVPIYSLPRESRLVVTLYGRSQRTDIHNEHDNAQQENDGRTDGDVQYVQVELASGSYLVSLWPASCDRRVGPAPSSLHAPVEPYPLLNIEIPSYSRLGVKWVEPEEKSLTRAHLPSFDSLDGHTQSQLLHLIEQGAYQRMPTE
ncbi:unnamed protein product [Leptidea sinapis]|uniref:Uncharacterized protein n=1 Tax=Leptidea sinapis TaxID=189913 RepID=A0A5E4R838_9NEOP|nr:unnamed protein product [Leptidea sinapis]